MSKNKHICPSCNGFGVIFPILNKKLRKIDTEILRKLFTCQTCDGEGHVSNKKLVWIEQGKFLRNYRLETLRLGLREASRKFKLDPSNLSKMERGIIKPQSPKELYKLKQ